MILRRRRRDNGYVILAVAIYMIIGSKYSFTFANICLGFVCALIIVLMLRSKRNNDNFEFDKTRNASQKFTFNSNTFSNQNCIVRYFPNEKIVVMDNPLYKSHSNLRAFIVDKTNHESVKRCWNDIYSYYDEYTTLDSLFSFVDKASGRLNLIFFTQGSWNQSLKGMEDYIPKQPEKKVEAPKFKKEIKKMNFDDKIQDGQIVVEFDDFEKKEIKVEQDDDIDKNIIDIQNLTDDDKMNINLADAQTISTLPGINIMIAKKIVEHRNINGFFKTKEDFINISGVKEHFKEKILSMISADVPSKASKNKKLEQERTVDL